jgi:tetratricopeptide (TPR) repeat protein
MDISTQHTTEHVTTTSPLFAISHDDSLLFCSNDLEIIKAHNELFLASKYNTENAIEIARQAINKYPDEPIFAYHLERLYLATEQEDMAHQVAEDNYRKFPLNLLIRSRYSITRLGTNKLLDAASAMAYTFDLSTLYPTKTTFHFVEIIAFYGFIVQYFCALKDFNRAASCIGELAAIDKKLPVIEQLSQLVIFESLAENLSHKNIELLLSHGQDTSHKNDTP